MKKKILIPYRIPKEGIETLFNRFDVFYPDEKDLTKEEIMKFIPEFHGVLSLFTQPFTREFVDAGKKLEIIANYGVGFNNVDIKAASEKGIVVTNTPHSVTEPTAELAFSLMLSLMRRVSECDRKLRMEPAFKWGLMENLGSTLWDKTIGIIGMGKIGKAIASRANAFGMKVIYHNRHQLPEATEIKYNATHVSFQELLAQSDIVNLSCPLTPETQHLIGKKEFEIMKQTSILINTARGPIVNENDLVTALKTKKLAGAGLDVFENEPQIHPDLLNMDNVVVTPHIGTGTTETRINIAREAAQNMINFFDGLENISIVNAEELQ